MQNRRKLPIGLDNFEKLRNNDFYYVDKTKLIQQLMESGEKVNLFTRPRRFGKTLNMSMLRYFFEIGTDKSLFDDLYISQNRELCDAYCGKYPVVSVSLKNVDGLTYEGAKYRLAESIGREAERFTFLLDSSQLTENDKSRYRAMIDLCNGQYTMSEEVLVYSLQTLCRLLMAHYRQKVILLIDEYDVPLDKAFQHGYYKEMVALIRGLFGQALKTNDSLQFAVLTGCLRVSKESIFTGLNNFKVLSITDARFDEQFGFTENEVRNLLKAYGLEDTVLKDTEELRAFWNALAEGKASEVEERLTNALSRTISVLDPKGSEKEKEKFYHAFLSGLLVGNGTWGVLSNKETGDGYADLMVEMDDPNAAMILELKSVEKVSELQNACDRAIKQIHERRYDAYLRDEGRSDIWIYGIAFFKKRCKVAAEKML